MLQNRFVKPESRIVTTSRLLGGTLIALDLGLLAVGQTTRPSPTQPWYEVTIAKTQHWHFSDFLLSFRRNPAELEPHRAHEIINAYSPAFFDKYLRGQNSDLLKAPSGQYSEVTFKKKN